MSDEQKEKLQGLLVDQRELAQRAPLRDNVAAIRALRQQWEQKLIAVLSEDQQKKWEELKGEPFNMRARFRSSENAAAIRTEPIWPAGPLTEIPRIVPVEPKGGGDRRAAAWAESNEDYC